MPKVNLNALSQERKEHAKHMISMLKAQKGIHDYTNEEMGKIFFGKGRRTYENRLERPERMTLEEMFKLSEKLHVTVPELLGYKGV